MPYRLEVIRIGSFAKSNIMKTTNKNNQTDETPNAGRRDFLRKLGLAGAGGAAAFSMIPATASAQRRQRPTRPVEAAPPVQPGFDLDLAILNFALNLEYLEAEYYLYGVTGSGLETAVIGTDGLGTPGPTTVKANSRVPFATPAIEDYANEIAIDEANHVRFLREVLGEAKVARPAIDLQNSFQTLGSLIGVPNFDPFANELNFLLGAYVFEDVGVTAYKGASPLISDKGFLEAAAGILAVEGYHSGSIRTVLFSQGAAARDLANKISDVRDSLDGPEDLDQGILLGGRANIVPADGNSVAFSRSVRQVLNIVYGAPGASSGLFFPNGMNGALK